jgi:hypothetical protein
MFGFKLVYKRDNFLLEKLVSHFKNTFSQIWAVEKLVSHFKNTFSQIWVGPIEIVGGRWEVRFQDLGRYY